MSGDFQERALDLFRAGHRVVPIPAGTKGVHEREWTTWADTQDEAHVQRLVAKANGCGVGILSKWTAGVDIDVRNAELAQRLAGLAHKLLGWTVERIGSPPKLLLPYRVEQPFSKLVSFEFTLPDDRLGDKPHKVEILADGQQWVAYHIHPDTGRPYHWPEGELPAREELPELTEAQAINPTRICPTCLLREIRCQARRVYSREISRLFIEHAEAAIFAYGGKIKPRAGQRGGSGNRKPSRNGQAGTIEAIEAALAFIPNQDEDYDSWIQVGMAIKGALGEAGHDLWDRWSALAAKNVQKATNKAWKSFKPRAIGAGTIYYLAREHGWKPAPNLVLNPAKAKQPLDQDAIQLQGGELHTVTARAAEVLGKATRTTPFNGFYRMGGLLVRVARLADAAELKRGGIRRERGALVIVPAESDGLQLALTAATRWVRFDARSEIFVAIDAPAGVAKALLATAQDWSEVPILTGIVEAPTLRPDGSVLDQPGYDPATGLLFDPGGTEFPPVPESPSRDQALQALAMIADLLSGFPFADEPSRSVAVSGIITPLVRKACRAVPLHCYSAPKMASGKTLLATLAGYIASGRSPALMSQADDPAEEQKRLLAVLIEGQNVVVIDNVERPLKSDALCTVLTEPVFSGRLLGANRTVRASSAATFFATGNNLAVAGDLTARAVSCGLDPACERPEEREFQVDLHKVVPERRAELAVAALTIVRAYLAAGEPRLPIANFARFEDWSRLVRRPLVWLGMDDPIKGRERIEGRDPIRAQLGMLLEAWSANYPGESATVAQAIKLASREPAPNEQPADTAIREQLLDVMREIAGRGSSVNSRVLGNFISKHEMRVEEGGRFERHKVTHGAVRWKVVARGELGEFGELVSGLPHELSDEKRGESRGENRSDSYVRERGPNSPNSPNSPFAEPTGFEL